MLVLWIYMKQNCIMLSFVAIVLIGSLVPSSAFADPGHDNEKKVKTQKIFESECAKKLDKNKLNFDGLLCQVIIALQETVNGLDTRVTELETNGGSGGQGPQGEQGIQGEVGPQGETGEQGIQGEVGPQGETGEQGIQGEVGPQGETGAQGIQGIQGPKGDSGDGTGSQGPKGDTGETGATGATGSQGEKGDTGPQGIQGEQGDTGPQGIQGEQGDTGPAGSSGSSSLDLYEVTDSQTIQPNSLISLDIPCNSGDQIISGGFQGNSKTHIQHSYPDLNRNTWHLAIQNTDSSNPRSVIGYALCIEQ